ncbi:MAG TPA: DNA-formamidopyrimidine glycosylase family protein [Candidatus Limnocylindrales bacterium]|nr:DNA-formamidopyrimidine glycosylase family protein [Candidatus Limnocylindrales bacterium]
MAEGDTLARIAQVLGRALTGQVVTTAQARPGTAALHRVAGARVGSVEARGKHLLIAFDNGLTLHTHLGLHGSWHRYWPGERWRRPRARAAAIIETPGVVAVAFDAPTVELLDSRAVALHPRLAGLGPDASTRDFDQDTALDRLSLATTAERPIGEALLDQRIVAGLGNVYRSEVCFIERVNPCLAVGALDRSTLRRLLETGARLLRANVQGGRRVTTTPGTPGNLYVYGRTGRPCRRCGTAVVSRMDAANRRAYWCPQCQPA